MKEKLKSLIPHFAIALAGGVLPLFISLIWQQYLGGHMVGAVLMTVTYMLVMFLLLCDGFYRLSKGVFKPALVRSLLTFLALTAIAFFSYALGAFILSLGSAISFLVFGAVVALFTVLVFAFALVMSLLSVDWVSRAWVSGVALMCVLAVVLPMAIAPVQFFEGYRGKRVQYGKESEIVFSYEDPFVLDSSPILQKDPEKDFVVLNLTDIQLTDHDLSPFTPVAVQTFLYIDELIKRTNPSLITISGDIGCGYARATHAIATFIDSYGIPFAPVFGNHDHEIHSADANYTAEIFASYEHCLFQKGPKNLGVGNYMIHIMEGTRLVHTFFMMDSHDHATFKVDGEEVYGYDHFWNGENQQLDWYYWAVNGITAYQGEVVPSTVIAHIPLVQFKDAFENAWDYDKAPNPYDCEDYKNGCYKYDTAFGVFWDGKVNSAPVDNGFFALMQAMGSTEHFIVGHDHTNNYSVMYEGIRLTYALKTGAGCYWNKRLNGGTTITVGSDGHATVAHEYIEAK